MKIDLVKLVEEVNEQENIQGGIHKIFALTCLQKLVDMQEEAITVTPCCKSDSEQLVCVVDYLSNFTKGKNYKCKPDGKNHFEVYDDFGDWYSVHKKCFSKTELAN